LKLLNITNRYYIFIALVLMLIGNAFLVYRLMYLFDREITDHLLSEKQVIDDELYKQKQIQHITFTIGDHLEILPIDKFTTFRVQVKDTDIMDQFKDKMVKYRELSYEQQIDSTAYRIKIRRRLAEGQDIFYGLLITILIIGIDVIISFYLLNWWVSKKIWYPFYHALNVLKKFDLRQKAKVSFPSSDVEEFTMMNAEINKLMDKVSSDYSNLKEFTENMSHETQTPLAIIKSKMDLLMQSENLTEEQHEKIGDILEAVNRLSKMNKALILLTKIDNNQFIDEETFNIGRVIKRHLAAFDPFIKAKELEVSVHIESDIFVQMNPHLTDILVSNLLSNAIKYNFSGGVLKITCTEKSLSVENTGEPMNIAPDVIFQRFKKGTQADSIGLGLAIVKKICDYGRCSVSYAFRKNLHAFTVVFNTAKVFREQPIEAVT
jgi:signal transduction histidine kinase